MIKLMQGALRLCSHLTHRQARSTGIAFVDSSKLQVCHNLRIFIHQVLKGTAKRGKGIMAWFYGFKLHLRVNDQSGIISVKGTTANVDDRKPVPAMTDELWGCLYEDKDYISNPLERELFQKRLIIETVFDQLKNISQIEHSLHRSCISFMVNLLAGFISYSFQLKKLNIKITRLDKQALMQI
nr:transposase [Candidatus Enterovibrio escacola]